MDATPVVRYTLSTDPSRLIRDPVSPTLYAVLRNQPGIQSYFSTLPSYAVLDSSLE